MGSRQSCSKACSNCTADCTKSSHDHGDDLEDERPTGDPAGATFEETLEDLNSLDRHLMLFCASSNLPAVRWLLYLGAHWDACDANGTTCLHVACRAGSLSIVQEMMRYSKLLEGTDVAGWTPLHIAVLMGRRGVVVRLLQAGVPPNRRNSKGQLPTELCADNQTYEVLRAHERYVQQFPGTPWDFEFGAGGSEDVVGSRLQYEPFFVPRQALIRSQQYKKEFQKIGLFMFNQQPGYGLAFLVASGVTRDYPVDMSTFLRRSKVDVKQVGSFLGEAFSLSHTIRLEFINSVVLQHTGVVSALRSVFHLLQLPDDLQKINRLVHGVARIWWRQHERLQKDLNWRAVASAEASKTEKKMKANATGSGMPEEFTGLELKQYLTSSDALHQLMFSTVLLHWFIYKDGTGARREMEYSVWKKLNQGIETGQSDVPEHVQAQVHALVGHSFIPELAVATASGRNRGDAVAGGPDDGGGHGPGDAWTASEATTKPKSLVLGYSAALEGWAQIVGGGFPRPTGLAGMQTVAYRDMSSIFSEVTHTSRLRKSPLGYQSESALGGNPAASGSDALMGGSKKDDYAWLSLSYTLLFFSASPTTGAPYAFVELQKVRVSNVQPDARILTIVGAPEPEEPDGDLGGGNAIPASEAPRMTHGAMMPLVIVLLLPDGRWQELSLQKLDLRLPSATEMTMWSTHLVAACQGKDARVTEAV